jgi:hypothetical protein
MTASARAVQHHGAQARLGSQSVLRSEDALDHRAIDCIHLVGSVQPDVGDALVVEVNDDPIVHRATPCPLPAAAAGVIAASRVRNACWCN